MKKLKILYCLGSTPTGKNHKRNVGGAEIFVYEIIHHIDRRAIEPIILYAGDSPLIEKYAGNNIDVIEFSIKSKFDIFGILKLAKLIKSNKVDIIHSHGLRFDFAAAIVSLLLKTPLIITRHSSLSDFSLPRWKKIIYTFFDRISLFIAKYVVAISADCEKKLRRYYKCHHSKIKVIHCGIDFDKFDLSVDSPVMYRKEFGLTREHMVIGTVASLIDLKGIDILLQTVPGLIARFPSAIFIVVGEGPERCRLENLAEHLGIANHIKFLGYREDAFKVIRMFDIFVLPSKREGLPLVILEALYSGIPVVATNIGAVGELVQTGITGILVERDSFEQLSRAIEKLLSDQELRQSCGQMGHKLILDRFNIVKAAEGYKNLYEQTAIKSKVK